MTKGRVYPSLFLLLYILFGNFPQLLLTAQMGPYSNAALENAGGIGYNESQK
jgi:hypothetical protein